MTSVRFYEEVADELLKFAVIIAKHKGRWVFCKHRERDTYELCGGHREEGEAIIDTAKRELYEESGALTFDMHAICVYSVQKDDASNGEESFGMLYYADVKSFEPQLHYEIEKTILTKNLIEHWTYPDIQPALIAEAIRRGVC